MPASSPTYYERHKERLLAQQRAYYAANRDEINARARAHGDKRERGDRREYMRDWWARLRVSDPVRHEAYMKRINRTRAVRALPEIAHYPRLKLFDFRSRLLSAGEIKFSFDAVNDCKEQAEAMN